MYLWMLVPRVDQSMNRALAVQTIDARDVQSDVDVREVVIDHVGIDELRYPIRVVDRDGRAQHTIASVAMGVELPREQRGTHMSRFVETLQSHGTHLTPESVLDLVHEVGDRLNAPSARITLEFPYFLERRAPVSGLASLVEYGATVEASSWSGGGASLKIGVRVPVTSLCPCSKEISDYGAHNQRGYVQIEAVPPWPSGDASGIWLDDLIEIAEASGSVPVYPLLKRVDERAVTMSAYDNPVFVEDIVRNVAVALREDARVARFRVVARNQESIHDHSAVAEVRWDRSEQ